MTDLQIEMATTIEFQGGGLYDDKGQQIFAAKLLNRNAWLFLDTSRNIGGIVEASKYPLPIIDQIKNSYLHNDYAELDRGYVSEFEAMIQNKKD
tara:strand:- start:103 stop:384 length:282 start_codon:yes stop_codon:yes gene_type:complete